MTIEKAKQGAVDFSMELVLMGGDRRPQHSRPVPPIRLLVESQ
jgi:hypothetical protein